jgi:protein SCO1
VPVFLASRKRVFRPIRHKLTARREQVGPEIGRRCRVAAALRVSKRRLDHAGSRPRLLGRPSVIFFGYTSCPDVCPTTLIDLSNWLKALGSRADKLNVLFISIDPQRDTPAHLRDFLSSFDPHIRGLTGTNEQIAAVTKEFRVYYKRFEESDGGYTMDHTGAIYLMDKSGDFVASLSFKTEDSVAIERLRSLATS